MMKWLHKARYALAALGIFLLLLMAAIFVIPFFIDHEALRKQAEEELSRTFGYQVMIRESEASFGLSPSITFHGVIIRNAEGAISDKLLAADSVVLDLNLLDFLGGDYITDHLTLNNALIEIEEIQKDKYNITFPKDVSRLFSDKFKMSHITLNQGTLRFTPYQGSSIYELRSLNVDAGINESRELDVDAGFILNSEKFLLAITGTDISAQQQGKQTLVNIEALLTKGEETIRYKGNWGSNNQKFNADGTLTFALANSKSWLNLLDSGAEKLKLYDVFNQSNSLEGDVIFKYAEPALAFASKNLLLNKQALELKGQAALGNKTKFRTSVSLEKIEMSDKFASNYTIDQANDLFDKLLPQNMDGELSLNINQLEFGEISAKKFALSGTLLGGEFVINQANMAMEGDTDLFLFGILKADANRNINLDGNIEIIGKDIQTFMTSLKLDEHKLLANHEGDFRAKANLFLSARTSTISELRFQAGTFLVEGGIEYQPRGEINYQASMKIRGGKLDSLARYVNPTESGELLESNFDTPKITLPWLDSMENRYNLTLLFDDFTLFNQPGQRSRFIVGIEPEKMSLTSVDLNVGDIKFTGDIAIDQSEQIPKINADFYLSELSIDSFVGGKFRRHPVERENLNSIWDDKPLNVDFIKGYSGVFNMRFGVIKHPSFELTNAMIDAESDEGVWTLREVSGDIWDGQIIVKGDLDVTSIASAKMEFQLKNIFLHQFLESTVDLNAIRGRMNINGRIDTGGVSMNNLIDNLTANIVLNGQDIVIKGFDMAGLIQALPSVRSNSEVANTVRVALIRGQTTFRSVEGAFYIAEGKLKTHGLTLRSKHAIGTMTGEADLINWSMNYGILFRLPTLAISQFPELTLYFRKSMDDPLINADTRALESFMTQRRLNR